MISSVNHVTLSVKDLAASFRFYREVLEFQPLVRWKTGAYFLAGETWFCISQSDKSSPPPPSDYSHVAFTVQQDAFVAVADKIKKSGATIWQENTSDGDSLYFLDPDGHKLEIHASDWRTRLAAWKKEPWTELEFFI